MNGSNYLWHYGIKGMKWGVRRTQEELGHAPKGREAKKPVNEGRAKEQLRILKAANREDASDDAIDKALEIQRMIEQKAEKSEGFKKGMERREKAFNKLHEELKPRPGEQHTEVMPMDFSVITPASNPWKDSV